MMTDEQAAKIPGIKMIRPGVWREADDAILVLHDPALRELMVALEFLRAACEHAEGRYLVDRERLADGTRVGIQTLAKHKDRLPDYQMPSYWADVRKLSEEYHWEVGDGKHED